MRTRVKICGITNLNDALTAIEYGADAIGLVFYPPSPRNIAPVAAAEIVQQLPPFVTVVGLFVNADESFVTEVVDKVKIDLIQFHGDEPEAYCRQFQRPYIKALRMKDDLDLGETLAEYSTARAILLDTYKKGVPGGTGESFNWERVPHDLDKAIILAGGLNTANVGRAINTVRPYAVDVSGGVEKRHGIKDSQKIKDFISSAEESGQCKAE